MTDPDDKQPDEEIPPFVEVEDSGSPLRNLAQLFFVPALIVAVAVGVFLVMNVLVGGVDTPEEILDRVASGDSRRRDQAAFELSKRIASDPTILEQPAFRHRLLEVYRRSQESEAPQRRYLTHVLSQASIPEATDALLKATEDTDAETRLYAVVALGNARTKEALPRLLELTRDPDPGMRIVATAAVASVGDPSATGALEARLTDASVDVAWNAAHALAHLGSDKGEELLRRMLDADYLQQQPGITSAQTQQAMLMAVQGLVSLEQKTPLAERRALLEQVAADAPFPAIQELARKYLAGA